MEQIILACRVPEKLHPMAQSALDGWVSGWYHITGYSNPTKAFLYHATIVDSGNFQWAECLLKAMGF